jgi:glycerol uptake facilitator-like aquaporin
VTILLEVLRFLHLLGMATLVSAFFVQRRRAAGEGLTRTWLYGAGVLAVTGLAMVGVIDGAHINGGLSTGGHIKIGVKLLVLVVIGVLAMIGLNRPQQARRLSDAMGALTVVNVAIAVFWSA